MNACKDCRYSGTYSYDLGGKQIDQFMCRRYPPRPDSHQWPNVKGSDWCGEFRPKDPTPSEISERTMKL